MFVGVPRVWEKFKDKIEEGIREASGIKEVIMDKARVSGVDHMYVGMYTCMTSCDMCTECGPTEQSEQAEWEASGLGLLAGQHVGYSGGVKVLSFHFLSLVLSSSL